MPTPINRQSLTKDLISRYKTQHVGGTFDVKQRLKAPGSSPQNGDRMPIDGNEYRYSVDDFAVKEILGVTEFLDAQEANKSNSPKSKELSMYLKGFNNKRYK